MLMTELCIHLSHKNVVQAFDRLRNYLDDIKWLSANKLKLNPDKTEFIMFGSKTLQGKTQQIFPS